jgi:lysophospholipase L1-like esterase
MANSVPDAKRDRGTPDEVIVTEEPREPEWDPRVGVDLGHLTWRGTPRHRLVAIGDSVTHGYQSGAIFNTDISFPAIIAYELGWYDQFRFPRYNGHGGLPLNIELLLRDLEQRFGVQLDWWELPLAAFRARQLMDEVEDHWERGPGSAYPRVTGINHNLAVYGWDLRDALDRTAAWCAARLEQPKDDLLRQVAENNGDLAALYVLPNEPPAARALTVFGAAQKLGDEDDHGQSDCGIETLIVFLGGNNALPAVTGLKVIWSGDGYDDLTGKGAFTVWRPSHFAAELEKVAARVRQIRARHVIWCTVPHVTIAPIARGVATKVRPGSRYFPYYTRPWITDRQFNPQQDPCLTHQQARAIDSAIDQYNYAIVEMVRAARADDRKDWLLLDLAGVLDRLAQRRYIDDPLARPDWWQPYELPAALRLLRPVPDSLFLTSDANGRVTGGLFSIDGVHPTTVGYGILAQELVNVMRLAGVEFQQPGGMARPDPVMVDFARLIRRDTLINKPPANLTSGLGVLSWADELLDIFGRTRTFQR